MVPKFPAEWFFTFEYWQRQNSRAYRRCLSDSWTSLHRDRGRWMWKEVARTTASRAWQGSLFLCWSGCLGKSWSANDERCEDFKRLGSAGKKVERWWPVRGTVHQGSPTVLILLVFWCSLLAITQSRRVSSSWPAPFSLAVKEWEPVADRPWLGQVFMSSSHSSICGIGDSHDLGILLWKESLKA